MKNLRIGVAGLGRGKLFIKHFEQIPGCEVVAVCDSIEAALEPFRNFSAHTEYDEFLKEHLDIIAVITPGPVHAEQSVKAMESGAHVLCETPCVYSLAEAQEVVECVKKTGRKYMLAENYIWAGWMHNIKQKADEGLFGEIVYAEGDYTHDCRNLMLLTNDGYIPYAERDKHPDAKKSWRATDLPPIYYTSHTLGPLLVLMDDRVTSVVGMSTGCRTAPDLETIDLESALMQTEKGSIIRLTNGFALAHPFSTHYSIAGTKGSLKMQRAKSPTFVWYTDEADPPMEGWEEAPEEWLTRPDGADDTLVMMRDFVTSILNDTPEPIDVYRSMEFVLPGVLAHESAMQGGVKIEVPDLRT
ncbi:Gfo/Idh/MocA family protein [Planctomycetota bacterium]